MPIFKHTFLKAGTYRVGPNEYRTFSPDELCEYVENTKAMMAQGLDVPVLSEHAPPGSLEGGPVQHQFADALKTAGWVKDLAFEPATGEAVAFYEITSPQYAAAISNGSIRYTSPELREHYVDGLGREHGKTFAHFALTAKPRNPAQTRLSEDSQQFALQFSIWDEVKTKPADRPILQFVGDKYPYGYGKHGTGVPVNEGNTGHLANARVGAARGKWSKQKWQKPEDATRHQNEDTEEDNPTPVENPQGGAAGVPPAQMTPRVGARVPGQPRPPGPSGNKSFKPKYGKLGSKIARMAEDGQQFDSSFLDWPNVPPIGGEPQDFPSPGGEQPPVLPPGPMENPDIIQRPDDALRQKSQACQQLMDQLGLSLPADFDFSALGEGLDALLTALKTKIRAEQEAEEAEMAQVQSQQLQEQVPMAAQMAEEGEQFADHPAKEQRGKNKPPRRPRQKNVTLGTHMTINHAQHKTSGHSGSKKLLRAVRSRGRTVDEFQKEKPDRLDYRNSRKKKADAQMSTDTDLRRKLAAQKHRTDQISRQALRNYVLRSACPPGMKKALLGKVEAVQFSDSGSMSPSFTVQEAVDLFAAAFPQGMQFGDENLVERAHPRGERWNEQRVGKAKGDQSQFNDDDGYSNPAEYAAHLDRLSVDPGYERLFTPPVAANGNGKH